MNNTDQKYTDTQINDYMSKNPRLNVFSIAGELGVSTFRVGEAQHNKMKTVLADCRQSPVWGQRQYNAHKPKESGAVQIRN